MKIPFKLISIFLILILTDSCTKNSLTDVPIFTQEPAASIEASLTISIKNLPQSKTEEYCIGILQRNIFDESGKYEKVSEADFLLSQPINSSNVTFKDLSEYYKSEIFINIFQKASDGSYIPVTHSGNQLEYFVAFGHIEKEIDCNISKPDGIRKTTINVNVPQEYLHKEVFLVKEEKLTMFTTQLEAGKMPDSDSYIHKITLESPDFQWIINSPLHPEKYFLLLSRPVPEIPYLKDPVEEINYETSSVQVVITKETKKKINIAAIRGGEKLNQHEIYLIEKNQWPQVERIVKELHGHPEKDMYVEKGTLTTGEARFEVYCTEGTKEYVVYIPKWNTEYYDSYQKLEVAVNSETPEYTLEFEFPYNPPTSGGATQKTISMAITVEDMEGYTFGWSGGKVYVLNDAEKLKEAIYSIGYGEFEGLYSSDTSINTPDDLPVTLTLNQIEISSDKEVAIFMYPVVQGGFNFRLAVKRIPGANLTDGYKVTLTKDNLENIPF